MLVSQMLCYCTSCYLSTNDVFTRSDCLERFYQCHANRPGIAVLAFLVEDADLIRERYQQLHPNLLVGMWDYPEEQVKILEVYAYYDEGDDDADKTKRNADKGTILRFVQDNRQVAGETAGAFCPVPGLKQVDAKFDYFTQLAFCDHWVSNGKCIPPQSVHSPVVAASHSAVLFTQSFIDGSS